MQFLNFLLAFFNLCQVGNQFGCILPDQPSSIFNNWNQISNLVVKLNAVTLAEVNHIDTAYNNVDEYFLILNQID